MSAQALEAAAWKMTAWISGRIAARVPRAFPVSGLRGQLSGLLHSRQTAAMVAAVSLMLVIHAVRSAWFDIYGRWYSR